MDEFIAHGHSVYEFDGIIEADGNYRFLRYDGEDKNKVTIFMTTDAAEKKAAELNLRGCAYG